jgi:phosphatidylglycerophosphatase A
LIGLLWFGLLILTGHLWSFALGTLLGLSLSVRLCGYAEKILNQKDPPSVVLDEIAAMPVCFGTWVGAFFWKHGSIPVLDTFVSRRNGLLTIGVFAAFRLFDIWKPWPVRQSQSLVGGWGITVDDLLAAIYVALVIWGIGFMSA